MEMVRPVRPWVQRESQEGPYMRELERLLGYKTIKAKFSHVGNMEEFNENEEETEITFKTTYLQKSYS